MARRTTPLSREPYEAVVDGFTHGGEGVVRLDGKAVFVAGTIPGERVRIRVVDDRARWARAELLEVLAPSEDRVVPPCPYVPDCGGCDLQHVEVEGQRRLKRRVVVEQLERLGGLSDPPVDACRAVGDATGYRTHARLHAASDGRLGFHRAATTEVVPIDRCLVLADAAQAVRNEVGDATGAAEVEIRGHAATGTRAAVLHPDPRTPLTMPDVGPEGEPADILLAQPDGSTVAFRGDGVLTEQVAGCTFRFDAGAFFQANTAGAQAIVEQVLEAVGDVDGARVWDLYAGVGLLSIPLARAGADVLAVEGRRRSVEWLQRNAQDNGVGDRVLGRAADVAEVAVASDGAPDVIVLDPPRTGAGPDICGQLADLGAAVIVYVACDPAALARDAKALAGRGYRLVGAVPLDLFPMTHHIEVVATFRA